MASSTPGRETLQLTTSRSVVPLGFVQEGNQLFLIARERSAQWPVDALRDGFVETRISGERKPGTPTLVTDPGERERVLERFRSKYGPDLYARWYEHPARVLRVDLGDSDGGAVASSARYYTWLTAEFDNVASDYDRHITGNRMNRLLRDRSLGLLRPEFRRAHSLLEIGCGSGMETLPLLREGHEILAVDISERMLEVVRQKALQEGIQERLRTRQLRASELGTLVSEVGEGAFDGGYSTYGALNCEPELRSIPDGLHRLLRPGARFLAGVYNRWCAFEIIGYAATFQWSRAFARRRNPVPVGGSRFCVDVYAHSARDFERLFRGRFSVVSIQGVPTLLPPSDLTSYAEKLARHFETLASWDRAVGRRWPMNRLGDHFLMLMERN